MNDNNDGKALKSGVWYIICNFIVKGAVFVSTPLFTRLMTPDEVGLFSNISAWVNILTILTSLELASSITFAKFEYEKNLQDFVASVLVLSSTVTFLCYVIVLIFRDFFMSLFSVDFATLNIIFIYCLVSPALQMLQVKNRVLFKYKSTSVLSFSSVFLSIICSIVLVIVLDNKLIGRTFGYYGSLIIFNIAIYLFILFKSNKISTKYWKFALAISLPMIIHVLSGQLLSSCDRVMITKICGSEKNAMYSIAYTCATVISVLWNSLNTAWSPWAYDQMDKAAYHRLKIASRPYIIMFGIIVIAFLLISPELLWVMGGSEYLEAVFVIPPIVIGMLFQFVYSLYVNIEFFNKMQKITAFGTVIAAAFNIILNWILIPRYGYVAASYTTLIGYIILFAIHFIIVKKINMTWWYDTKFNFTVLIIGVVTIPIFDFLYINSIVRFSVIVFSFFGFIAVMIKIRKQIIQSLKSRSIKPVLSLLRNGNIK